MTEPRQRSHRPRPPLPETHPDPEFVARWLACAAALQLDRTARLLADRVDGRDLTVDTSSTPVGRSPYMHGRSIAIMVRAGLLEPAHPGRHRLVLPPEPELPWVG